MKSIANYTNKKSYSKIKKLSDADLESINQAKLKRLELGGANAHKKQVHSIPDVVNQIFMEYILTHVTTSKRFFFTTIH